MQQIVLLKMPKFASAFPFIIHQCSPHQATGINLEIPRMFVERTIENNKNKLHIYIKPNGNKNNNLIKNQQNFAKNLLVTVMYISTALLLLIERKR